MWNPALRSLTSFFSLNTAGLAVFFFILALPELVLLPVVSIPGVVPGGNEVRYNDTEDNWAR